MASLRDLEKQLRSLKKQIPFATAQALSHTAKKIQDAEKLNMQKTLENPTLFTINSVKSAGARKSSLSAKVYVMPTAEQYLAPLEFGGEHYLSGKALLNPKNVRLNKYGNLPKGKLSSLDSKPNVFVGKIDGARGFWQRKKYKKVSKRAKRSKNGTRRAPRKQPKLKLLIRYGDAIEAQPVLNYFEVAQQLARDLLPVEINAALALAMKTAKK